MKAILRIVSRSGEPRERGGQGRREFMTVPSAAGAARLLVFAPLLAFAWFVGLGSAQAQTIVNPSFEADNFAISPGFVVDNGPITGWTASADHIGVDGNFNVYTDNGVIPDGTHAAFMEDSLVQAPASLSQIVTNFIVGKKYRLRYYENAQTSVTPAVLTVTVGGAEVVPLHAVQMVGGTNRYTEVLSSGFTATNTELPIAFLKSIPGVPGTSAALIDNVSIFSPTGVLVNAVAPTGTRVSPNDRVSIQLEEFNTTLNTSSIALTFNGAAVTPEVSLVGGLANIQYDPPGSLPASSSNVVVLTYADTRVPPVASTNQFSFVVRANPPLGAYTNAVMADKPVVYWRFSETNGPVAADSSTADGAQDATYQRQGEQNTGALAIQTGPTIATGNTAVVFNGDVATDGSWTANTDNVAASLTLGDDYTMEMWFYNTRPFAERYITGYLISRGDPDAYDTVGIGGSAIALGQLFFFNGTAVVQGKTVLNLNQWYHLVMVRSGTDIRLYLNGQLEASGTADRVYTSGNIAVGMRSNMTWPAKGGIDEVAIYDKALSQAQVLVHWDAVTEANPEIKLVSAAPTGPAVSPYAIIVMKLEESNTTLDQSTVQLALNHSAVTPSISKAGTTTTIQYDPPGALPANSSNLVTLVYADNSVPPVWRTNEFSFVVKPTALPGAYTNAVIADQPIVYWRLNEKNGPDAADASGKGNNGLYRLQTDANANALTTQVGPLVDLTNTAVVFNGDLTAADNVYINLPLGDTYTAELWFYNTLPFDARLVTGYLFGRGTAFDSVGLGGTAGTPGRLFFWNGFTLIEGKTPLALNQWYYAVLVRSGADVSLYLNGLLEASGTADAPIDDDITIGIRSDLQWPFQGAIDEVALYTHALSASRILTHWVSVLEPNPEIRLDIVRSGGQLVITWSGSGSLEETAQVTSGWTAVPGATTGTYTVTPTGTSKFYRVRQP